MLPELDGNSLLPSNLFKSIRYRWSEFFPIHIFLKKTSTSSTRNGALGYRKRSIFLLVGGSLVKGEPLDCSRSESEIKK